MLKTNKKTNIIFGAAAIIVLIICFTAITFTNAAGVVGLSSSMNSFDRNNILISSDVIDGSVSESNTYSPGVKIELTVNVVVGEIIEQRIYYTKDGTDPAFSNVTFLPLSSSTFAYVCPINDTQNNVCNWNIGSFTSGTIVKYASLAKAKEGGWSSTLVIGDYSFAVTGNVFGYAWSESFGWISFNSVNCDNNSNGFIDAGACGGDDATTPIVNYGVNVNFGAGNLSGVAWSENAGWISFNWPDIGDGGASCPSDATGATCQPRYDSVNNEFLGWARACSVFQTGCSGALKSNFARGGWDGWISLNCLNGDVCLGSNYKVSLDGADFVGWAWGSDVVGWISFNSVNCDKNAPFGQSDGSLGCPALGTPMASYKVYLAITNNNPDASNLSISADYCALVPVRTFSWIYSDLLDSSPDNEESQFQLQIDDNNDFSSPEVNICGDGTAPLISGDCSAPGALSIPSGSVNFKNINVMESPGADQLGYNKTYYWRVMVWDSNGGSSGWAEYDPDANPLTQNPIGTPLHSYPNAHFTCSPNLAVSCPADHDILELITFDNDPDPGANPNPDRYAPYTFNWDFCKGAACPNKNAVGIPANHTYITEGSYDVELTVSDATLPIDGGPYICAFSQTLNIVSARPKWNEINP